MEFDNKVSRRLSEIIRDGYKILDIEMSVQANRDLNKAFFVHKLPHTPKYLKSLAGAPVRVNSRIDGKEVRVRYQIPMVGVIKDELIRPDTLNDTVLVR